MRYPAPWSGSFRVVGNPDDRIELAQLGRKTFAFGSKIVYMGDRTGLEGKVSERTLAAIRVVSPESLPTTDLASVPAPLQWFVNRYGLHTPAALVHDALIGAVKRPSDLTDAYADRFFRFMLKDLDVPLIRRWLMWAATALRTRYVRGGLARIALVAWVLASSCGMTTVVIGAVREAWDVVAAASLMPFAFAALWGRQYGAGIVAAYTAPWVLPPTLFGAGGYCIYWLLETALRALRGDAGR